MTKSRWVLLALAVLVALPAVAADRVPSGFDLWVTPPDGTTYTDFAAHPIPADFFCPGSAPFTDKVALRGMPVSKDLGGIDTVVERLDEAAFDANGQATVRLRLKAIGLESIAPLKTSCGEFRLRAHLDGEQPITSMVVTRTTANSGYLRSSLALNLKLSFEPVGRRAATRHLRQTVKFPHSAPIPWVNVANTRFAVNAAWLDTTGDGKADAQIPLGESFMVGFDSDLTAVYWEGHCDITQGTCDENHNVVGCSPTVICPVLADS